MPDTLFDRDANEARRARLRQLGWREEPATRPGAVALWVDPQGKRHDEVNAFAWVDRRGEGGE